MEASQRKSIVTMWLGWQFYEVPAFLLQVWGNYLKFAENYFSLLFLLRTLFSPWRRFNWQYPRSLDIYQFSLTFVSNLFSRFLGAIMRIVLIIMGILLYVLVACGGFLMFIGWIAMPFIILGGFLLLFII